MTKPIGLHCTGCGKRKFRTIDSRATFGGIRRRKECTGCGYRVTTFEAITRLRRVPTRAA